MKHSGGALLSSISINRDSKKKISTQVFMGIREIILSEGLKAGERLPASRTLANDLNVSRTTIINAVERLISEGLLEARSGAGTFVSDIMYEDRPSLLKKHPKSNDGNKSNPIKLSKAITKALPNLISRDKLAKEPRGFITGLPALNEFPMSQWLTVVKQKFAWRSEQNHGIWPPLWFKKTSHCYCITHKC